MKRITDLKLNDDYFQITYRGNTSKFPYTLIRSMGIVGGMLILELWGSLILILE